MIFNSTKLGLTTLVILAVLMALGHFKAQGFSSNSNNSFDVKNPQTMTPTPISNNSSPGLKKIVDLNLQGTQGNYGMVIKRLQTKEEFRVNDQESFSAASLYKLVLMAAIYKDISLGDLSLDDPVKNTQTHLKDIFNGAEFGYENMPERLEFSVEQLLGRVARISDNFAAIMLTEKIRQLHCNGAIYCKGINQDPLAAMSSELGMTQTDFSQQTVTTNASDIARYFMRLYEGKVVSPKVSNQILSLLTTNQLNNRIPAKLPKQTVVAHKTGELPRVRHDAGIVFLEDSQKIKKQLASDISVATSSAYLIVVLSDDLKYEDEAVSIIAQISKDVYDYFAR